MNVSAMFKAKARPARPRPGGMSREQADAIHKEFDEAMAPLGIRATEYFSGFTVNGQKRTWLLPSVETYEDVPIEKKAYVLRFKAFFLAEIAKQETDNVTL